MIKRRIALAGAAGWTIVSASAVRAQAWPSQPIRLVVPYAAGGSTDTAGRIVAEKLTGMLGQQVIVENKGGGNTIIGMDVVAKAKPDGNTLLLGASAPLVLPPVRYASSKFSGYPSALRRARTWSGLIPLDAIRSRS